MALTEAGKALEEAEKFWLDGNIQNAYEAFGRSRLIYQQNEDKIGEAAALTQLGDLERRIGKYETALETYTQAKKILASSSQNKQRRMAGVYMRIGELYIEAGEYEEAKEALILADEIYDSIGNMVGVARISGMLGKIALKEGRDDVALDYYKTAREIYREEANTQHEAGTLVKMAELHMQFGDKAKANIFHEKALELYEQTGDMLGAAWSRFNIGTLMHKAGDIINAREMLDAARDGFKKAGHITGEAKTLLELARAEANKNGGDMERSRAHYKQAIDRLRTAELPDLKEQAMKEFEKFFE